MGKIWRVREQDQAAQRELAAALKISPVTAQLLINRGVRTAADAGSFLVASLASCHDPLLLKDMDKAVARVRKAIAAKERILVYGDYDVDGITSVALVSSAVKALGGDVEVYIPNRVEEGYGLNIPAIKKAERDNVTLIITVDCGITSFSEVEQANSLGIDVVITDHHELVGARIPAAFAVINSLQPDCHYPFKHLAGVGLAYKLVKALYTGTKLFAEDFLDLVALGTVADVAPLVGENRTLTFHGLAELNRRGRIGLDALANVGGLSGKDISSGHIGFILGPRINAMGRIGSALKSLELILSKDKAEAALLAKVLDTENRNRQKIEGAIVDEAVSKVEREVNFKDHRVIVLASEHWHPGVIGIVASRIADRFYRPTILISLDGKLGRGSGRSIDDFHLFDYLMRCRDTLIGFGGHEAACGVTIDKDRIDEFRAKINSEAAKDAGDELFKPKLDIEMEIPLGALKGGVIDELDRLAPFGTGNPRPVLAARGLKVVDGPRKIGKNGFKIVVAAGSMKCEAVSFGRGAIEPPAADSTVDIAFIPSINEWQGLRSIQLEIKDIVKC